MHPLRLRRPAAPPRIRATPPTAPALILPLICELLAAPLAGFNPLHWGGRAIRRIFPGVANLPIAQIKQAVQPTGDQLTAFDDLNTAAAKANDVVKSSCPTAMPLTPAARLDAAQARLEAMMKAVDIVRGPLQMFYDSLSDEQRQRFDAMGNTGNGHAAVGGNIAALCGQQSGDVADLPVQRIEQVVQPNGQQQQQAFDALKQASRDAAQQLQSSCPAQVPQTPVARLDAVKTRLQAMVDAMNTVRPKLHAFYASLGDEQKALQHHGPAAAERILNAGATSDS